MLVDHGVLLDRELDDAGPLLGAEALDLTLALDLDEALPRVDELADGAGELDLAGEVGGDADAVVAVGNQWITLGR